MLQKRFYEIDPRAQIVVNERLMLSNRFFHSICDYLLSHPYTVSQNCRPTLGTLTVTQDNAAQHNAAQHNAAQHNAAQHNAAQHNAAQHNAAQHNATQQNTIQQNASQQNAA